MSADVCDALSNPVNGTVTVSQEGATSKASYRCNAGYTLVGAKERLCLNGGSWEMSEPTCSMFISLAVILLQIAYSN